MAIKKIFLLIIGAFFACYVFATEFNYSVEKSFLLDSPRSMTVDQLSHEIFTPYTHDLHLGFQANPVWLKFDIKPPFEEVMQDSSNDTKGRQIILKMGPYQLDSIESYEFINNQWIAQKAGDREVVSNRICPDDTHCLALSSPSNQPVTVFLKIYQRGIFSVRAEVITFNALAQSVANATGRYSASIAIAASLLFMAFVLLVIERSWLLITFCVFQAVVVVFILTTTGRLQIWLPEVDPVFFDTLAHHLFSLRVLMFILLGWASLAQYQLNYLYKSMVAILVALILLSNILIQFGEIKSAILVYLLASSLNLFVQSYGIGSATNISIKIRNLLILAYAVYFVVLVGALLVIFGQLMPVATLYLVNSFADWRINGGPAGIIIFLIVIIQQSERKVSTSQEIGLLRLEAASSKAHQEKLTERQTLIDMLTHELKNPLGAIRFSLATLKNQTQIDTDAHSRVSRMDRSVERINELIEHVAHSNKIDRFELNEDMEVIDADELIDELTSDFQSHGRFEFNIEKGAYFLTHRKMLTMVIENLVSNAYKYDAKHFPINIKVNALEKSTIFEILNSIDSNIRPDENKLFQRYYRHDGVQSLPGMGIGLSLVEAAAEKIGAKVSCVISSEQILFKVEVPK